MTLTESRGAREGAVQFLQCWCVVRELMPEPKNFQQQLVVLSSNSFVFLLKTEVHPAKYA